MPFKDKQARQDYNKQYYENTKEQQLLRAKIYRDNNKDKIKQYRVHGTGLIARRKANWRCHGIISDDWDKTEEQFANTTHCEGCNKEFLKTSNRCLDHDHGITDKPNVRNVLCQRCNIIRSYIDNDYQLVMKLMSMKSSF